ncbi:unnamed protein product [Pieris brassicae]|uniref:Uncharacterized protein n=1 Tax=Pieris brassicae TaxID=7116 RepID=A0A9P0TDV3_PIEBR|nr:unnamed protein product [Pieris brassicae]
MDRRKNPCGSQRQLESRSGSELSSLEQPESVDSRRASNMLTNTEYRSRNSCTDTDGGRRRTVRELRRAAQLPATYLPAADPTEKVRVFAPCALHRSRTPNGPRRSRMRCCRCTGVPDIGRAHPGGRRGIRPFTPGRRPRDCTTALPRVPRAYRAACPGS